MIRKGIKKLHKSLNDKRFIIITGARQMGKTTLVKQFMEEVIPSIPQTYYFTLEDPQILNAINEHPENIFRYTIQPQQLEEKERMVLIIDEVQYAENPSNFLKYLYDTYAPKLKIIATGSSAFYIDRKFKDSLAGRKIVIELFSLDFEEFLTAKNQPAVIREIKRLKENPGSKTNKAVLIRNLWNEYVLYGGYPGVILTENENEKIELLKELINSYMRKDILESGIGMEDVFFSMSTLLAHQTGSLLNVHELANTLRVSSPTIENYIYILQKSFHVNLLKPKFGNIRKELTKMPKIFFNDTGLRNVLVNNFLPIETRPDKGELFENAVYNILRQQYGQAFVKYWRTADGNEVDFVIETGEKSRAIETKFDYAQFKPSKYKKFSLAYPEIPLETWTYLNPTDSFIERQTLLD